MTLFRLRSTSAVASLVLIAVVTSGCSSNSSPTATPPAGETAVMPAGCGANGALVLAIASHANVPAPIMTARMQQSVRSAAASHAAIGLVEIDGTPTLVAASAFHSDAGNHAARVNDEQSYLSSIGAAVAQLRAASAHADDLTALRVAAQAVRAACPTGGTVFFEDAGLQEMGGLNYAAAELLSAQPAEIVAFLDAHDELPDLSRINVVLVGIADTALPQVPLDQASRDRLVTTWTLLMSSAGAASISVDSTPHQGPSAAGLPPVTTVSVPSPPTFPVPLHGSSVVRLPDAGPVGFIPDEAVFRDPRAAAAALDQLAAQLRRLSSAAILLTGTTSSYGGNSAAAEKGRIALSNARAEKVRAELIRRGVNGAWLRVRGVGTHFAGFQPDEDAQGNLLPGPAEANRSVIVSVDAS